MGASWVSWNIKLLPFGGDWGNTVIDVRLVQSTKAATPTLFKFPSKVMTPLPSSYVLDRIGTLKESGAYSVTTSPLSEVYQIWLPGGLSPGTAASPIRSAYSLQAEVHRDVVYVGQI